MVLAGWHRDGELSLISRAARQWFVTQMSATLVHRANKLLDRSR